MRKRGYFFILGLVLCAGGCKLSDKQWDINMLVPIAHADLTISNMIQDTSLKRNADSSLYLVNVQQLNSLNISSLLTVPDTNFEKTVSLKTITLGQRTIKHNVSLGEVISKAYGIPAGILQGQRIPIKPINSLSLGSTTINAQSLFTNATFIGGTLQLSIYNGFPIEITNIHYQLLNQSSVVIDDTINSIMPNATHISTYPLAGKTLSASLTFNVINMSSPGTNGDSIKIDTGALIKIVLTGSNMQVSAATAVFPAQNLVNDNVDVNYNLRGPLFKSFIIRSGEIDFKTTSSIQDTIHMTYSIPGATKNGQSIKEFLNVPPAGSTSITIYDSFKLNGYNADLTGQHKDSFNTFFNILTARIDSTGKLESLSLADSIYIYYGLFHVIPEYALGYLGTKSYTVGPQTAPFNFFKNISANKLTIPQLNVNLQISNGIGAPVSGVIKSITAFNSKTNQSVPLKCSKYINVPINIPAAKDTNSQSIIDLPLNNLNSNINNLLEILPDKLLYLLSFTVDPNGNTSNYNDFIYYGSTVAANLNIQLPLQFGADGLLLEDTMTANLTNNVDVSKVQDGTLHLNISNGYPLSAKIQLYILDNTNKITDSLFVNASNSIPAGSPVVGSKMPGIGNIDIFLSQRQWQEIADKKRLILKVLLNTYNKQVVKIYSNAHFVTKLTANFRYRN